MSDRDRPLGRAGAAVAPAPSNQQSQAEEKVGLGNPDFRFRSDQHAWASGLIAGALTKQPELRARPAVDQDGNALPQVLLSVGGRKYSVLIEELQ